MFAVQFWKTRSATVKKELDLDRLAKGVTTCTIYGVTEPVKIRLSF
jgi:hypothetical protein